MAPTAGNGSSAKGGADSSLAINDSSSTAAGAGDVDCDSGGADAIDATRKDGDVTGTDNVGVNDVVGALEEVSANALVLAAGGLVDKGRSHIEVRGKLTAVLVVGIMAGCDIQAHHGVADMGDQKFDKIPLAFAPPFKLM